MSIAACAAHDAALRDRLTCKPLTANKWHLGLGEGEVDWNAEIKPGPNEIGFDYHFLIPSTGDRVPCVYLEQGRVVNHDQVSLIGE